MATASEHRTKRGPVPEAGGLSPASPITGALISAITDEVRNVYALGRAAGVEGHSVAKFLRRKCDLKLGAADRLAVALGIRLVRGPKALDQGTRDDQLTRPIIDELRAAIIESDLSLNALGKASGVNRQSIAIFVRQEGGMMLESADRLAVALGIEVIRGLNPPAPESPPGPRSGPITDALLAAIAASGLSSFKLSRMARVDDHSIRKFVRHEHELRLGAADRLAGVLRIKLAGEPGPPVPDVGTAPPASPLVDELREAIARSGLSFNALGRAACVFSHSIVMFVRHESDLTLASADRLAVALGIKVVHQPKAPSLEDRLDPPARPITDALLTAIEEDGRNIPSLAREAGLSDETTRRFARREGTLMLTSVDKLAYALGVKVAPGSEVGDAPPVQKISDALREAIARSGLSYPKLALKAGSWDEHIRQFFNHQKGLTLASADRLAVALGISLVREPREPRPIITEPLKPSPDELRQAIARSGLSPYRLAKRSGVSSPTICRLLDGQDNLKHANLVKLAEALGLKVEPAGLQADPAEVPSPAEVPIITPVYPAHPRPCPVEMRKRYRPPIVGGVLAPRPLSPSLSDIVTAMVRLHKDGKTRNPESTIHEKSGRKKPIRTIKKLLKKEPFWIPWFRLPGANGLGGYGLKWPDETD